MVESLGSFMKIVLYLLAACRSTSAQYDKFHCEKVVEKNNSTTLCKLYSNKNFILPIENIPANTETLIINTLGTGSLTITNVDIFKNFEQLKNLEIRMSRGLHISEKFLHSGSINYLQNLLFNIPNLKTLSIKYNQFNNKTYSWMLPANLEKLYLSNGVFEFDLRNCSHLAFVRLNRNKLSKIPSFYNSTSALKILDLRRNPLNEFNVDDIADLCYLRYYAMDTSQITKCECNKLKQWMMKLQEWGDFTFGGSLNCSDNIESYTNCTLEEAMLRREKKCATWWNKNKKWILLAAGEGGGIMGLALALGCACCFGYCVICCFCVGWMMTDEPHNPPLVQRGRLPGYPGPAGYQMKPPY